MIKQIIEGIKVRITIFFINNVIIKMPNKLNLIYYKLKQLLASLYLGKGEKNDSFLR